MTRTSLTLVALLALAGAYAYGRHDGARLTTAAHDATLLAETAKRDALAATLADIETARLREVNRTRLLTQALEDKANAQPVTAPACLPVDRVRRLNVR
ncbi:MAG: hypothetical protein ACRC14_01830 [Paracoccaceae bacterium]